MKQRTCSVDDCDAQARARGWCGRHYNRWYYSGSPDVPEDGSSQVCKRCSAPLPPKANQGPRSPYCSRPCRRRADYERHRERRAAEAARANAERRANTWAVCDHCSADFNPRQNRSRFCSERCQRAWAREHERGECSAPECARPIRARGVCNMHYKRILRDEGKLKGPPWDDAKRDAKARREALKRGNRVGGPVVLAKIAERDGWKCGICGKHVRGSLTYPHPLSKSLDHVIPLSRGGAHSPENAQLAHLRCNVRKGNRKANDQLALIG